MRSQLLLLALLSFSCSATQTSPTALSQQQLLREFSFMYPAELAEVKRSLIRNQLAEWRAAELGLTVDSKLAAEKFSEIESKLRASVDGGIDDWSKSEHGMPWSNASIVYRDYLESNLLYRTTYFADSSKLPQMQVAILTNTSLGVLEEWQRALELGQHPDGLGARFEQLPLWSADKFLPGMIIGPIKLPSRVWLLARVMKIEATEQAVLSDAQLLEMAANHEISPLAAELWINEMTCRYNNRN
ncbi:MAG: hypothetical protein H8E25_09255 [Planctomycetes bacterium]|nr:hypothetical protein [Planctomycetota bacterium]